MANDLIAKASVIIMAPEEKVWDALTNPSLIKKYFFGTEASYEWKVGSALTFRGVWEGKSYEDKGKIVEIEKNRLLRYTYLSSMAGKEDIPENYANITYTLTPENDNTMLTISQDHNPNEQSRDHSQKNWETVMDNLKKLMED